jgi:hypothetical protein
MIASILVSENYLTFYCHQTLRKPAVLLLRPPSSSFVRQNLPRTAHARPRPARPLGIPEGWGGCDIGLGRGRVTDSGG